MQIENSTLSEETKIIVGLVVSTHFFEKISPYVEPEYFKNSYLRKIAKWCIEYYSKYKKAPYKHIKDIYLEKKKRLKKEEASLIKNILQNLSGQYAGGEINVEYLLDKATDYIDQRKLEIVTNNVDILRKAGKIEAAEEQLLQYETLQARISSDFYTLKPGDEDLNERIYAVEKQTRPFFQLPGDLGRYLGKMERSDLVSYFGPAKIGKTNVLLDHFKHGILQRKKTVFFSLEMTDSMVVKRTNKLFVPMVDIEGHYDYPVFDCVHNQTGDCKDRLSPVSVLDDGFIIPDPKHEVCLKCRESQPDKFSSTIYQQTTFREQEDIFTVRKAFKSKSQIMKTYGRIIVYPKYTLTYNNIKNELNNLIRKDQFIPDIIIIDYADILKFDTRHSDFKVEDERWKLLAQLAGETNSLVITATQANLAGHKADTLDSTHQGGFYGKNRHVNLMCGLNQNKEQKEQGVMEFGITEARDQFYIQGNTCTVLQDVKSGQIHLDSYCEALHKKKI